MLGGPAADTGLTGRKIIVDTYGGYARHGGGAFSGKDPSKVDRSACYAARYVAKHLVAEGLARRAEVALAYAIGVAKPVSVQVNTFGTGVRTDEQLSHEVMERFDLSPDGIIRMLDLRRPIYRQTAAYGHFGRPGPGFALGSSGLKNTRILGEAAVLLPTSLYFRPRRSPSFHTCARISLSTRQASTSL